MIGHRWDNTCGQLRQFLARNQITFDWMTPDASDLRERWPGTRPADEDCPVLKLADGTLLRRPATRDLARRLGLETSPRLAEYDTMIIGGGPAGLAAAVYAASEGLRTLVVEREAPGGQAGTSSRIENYLGFPSGVSGDELASRALKQARRLGAEILVTRSVDRIDPQRRHAYLDGGDAVLVRTIILATGVTWRHLTIEGFDRLIGKGIYYGAARSEAANPWTRRPSHRCRQLGRASRFALRQSRTNGDARRPRRFARRHVALPSSGLPGNRTWYSCVKWSLARRHAFDCDRHPRWRRERAAARLRWPLRFHWRRRGDRLAAGGDRTRCAWICPDR
jgi:hypothetical protein